MPADPRGSPFLAVSSFSRHLPCLAHGPFLQSQPLCWVAFSHSTSLIPSLPLPLKDPWGYIRPSQAIQGNLSAVVSIFDFTCDLAGPLPPTKTYSQAPGLGRRHLWGPLFCHRSHKKTPPVGKHTVGQHLLGRLFKPMLVTELRILPSSQRTGEVAF